MVKMISVLKEELAVDSQERQAVTDVADYCAYHYPLLKA